MTHLVSVYDSVLTSRLKSSRPRLHSSSEESAGDLATSSLHARIDRAKTRRAGAREVWSARSAPRPAELHRAVKSGIAGTAIAAHRIARDTTQQSLESVRG